MKELQTSLASRAISSAFHGKAAPFPLLMKALSLAEVRQARERGVIFDAANGRKPFFQ